LKTAKDIMHSATFIRPEETVANAAKLMAQKVIGSVLIGTKEKPLGIFTERDILTKIVAENINPKYAKVKDHMSSPVVTIPADASMSEAQNKMNELKIKRLPVEENKIIIGIITARNLMQNATYDFLKTKRDYGGSRESSSRYW
jgi:CBS domain-containing protein